MADDQPTGSQIQREGAMSAFWTTCPQCGARYFHMFVGAYLLAGHSCEPKGTTKHPPKIGHGLNE